MKLLISLLTILLLMAVVALAADPAPSASADQVEAVKGNNAFAVELYTQLSNQPGNLFFSPESISTALAMTYAGARGDTAAEMAKTLHFTLPQERLHPAMAGLLRNLNASHDAYQLKVANALWAQQDYQFLNDFLKLTRDNYGAGFNKVDFKTATELARQTINAWVEQQTENKIKDLLQRGILTPRTRLVLTNAIYFKGDWQTHFNKEDTRDEDFHLLATQNVKAPLMHRTGEFNYFDGGSFQALEIPYKNKEMSMIVFLPKAIDGLPAFEQSMTATSTSCTSRAIATAKLSKSKQALEQWLSQLRPVHEIIVTMPKFRMASQFGLLGDTLAAMGMPQAFDERMADFSAMIGKRELFISAVIHKAYVDVNEEGTEAAAATAVVMDAARATSAKPLRIIFRADHPFVFLIRDNRSGSILFIGRVTDPSK